MCVCVCVCVCMYVCMYAGMYVRTYLQVLPDLRNFKLRNLKYNFGRVKELIATRTKRTEFWI
jgi:hypothetical protein